MPSETVLITGASSGIGMELAHLFAADKSNLVLVARRSEKLEPLAETLRREHGIEVRVLVKDLSRHEAPAEIQQVLNEEELVIDVLVNNAGFGVIGPFARLPLQEQLNMAQVNALALTHLSALLLPPMLQRNRGRILNLGSTAAFQPGPGMAIYFATKAYVLSLSEALAEETRGSDVRVTCLCPGPTATEFAHKSGMDTSLLFRLGTMDAKTVARSGYRAMRRGRAVVVPGAVNWLVSFSIRLVPRWVSRKLCRGLLTRTT